MSELRLTLTRDTPQGEHTYGIIEEMDGEPLCVTMEPGTNDRDFPRVPEGFYHLIEHRTENYDSVALVGWHVSHMPTPGVDRSAILIHAGNTDNDTRGCILVGVDRGELNGEAAILSSRIALDVLLDIVREADRAYLRIR